MSTEAADNVSELSDRDQAILDFERKWWKYAGAREGAIREQFGMSSARYQQILQHLIDTPAAEAYDAQGVHRLRRLRERRQRARGARAVGF